MYIRKAKKIHKVRLALLSLVNLIAKPAKLPLSKAVKIVLSNKLTLNQLRNHPYLNFYQAKEICDYRRQRGPIKSLNELKLLKDFPPDEIERLKPYICF